MPEDDRAPEGRAPDGVPPEADTVDGPALSGIDAAKEALARARAASSTAPDRRATNPTSSRRRRTARGQDPDPRSGPGPDARDPQLLGPSIDRIMRDRGWEQPTAVGGLTGRWAEIVGADVAEHVRPETFEPAADGRGLLLVLRADSTTWAYSMRQLLPNLRTRLDAELGPGTIRDISVLGPAAPSWKHGKLHVKGRGPRDTYG